MPLIVVALAGLAVGRFVLYEPATRPAPPPPRTTATLIGGLEGAVAARPGDATSWQQLGVAYVRRAAETADPTYYAQARRALRRAAKLAPRDPETLLARGALALALHDFPAALALGSRAHAARPLSPEPLGVMVDAQVELGRYRGAVADLQRMLDVRPGLPALSRTSYVRELYGDLDGAVAAMRRAEAAGSGSPFDLASVSALLGDLHFTRGELERAEDSYQRAHRTSPGLFTAAVGRARVAAARGHPGAALDRLRPATRRYPEPAALTLLGDLLAAEGRTAEARRSYELVEAVAALQARAGQDTDLEMALFAADRADDPAAAVALGRRAYRARPDNVYAADAVAWALHRAGRADAALPYARRALRLGTADPLLRYHAAAILDATGRPGPARRQLRAAASPASWFSARHVPDAAALAERLGMPVPAAWRP
ncbi:MAG: tetratricopeptide repeat protein [Actinobacteria bacterium]|nr:tetratricopeptide repeat protein [Actinomycetota bacterium]